MDDLRVTVLRRLLVWVDVEFVLGDVTDLKSYDWTDGDVLFANSTCFDDKVGGQEEPSHSAQPCR